MDFLRYAEGAWLSVGMVWLLGALASKRAKRSEPVRSRIVHLLIMGTAFVLLARPELSIGPLAWRFVPEGRAVEWLGLILTVAGCAFAVWARLLLGGNWSASVTLKQDHRLIRRGPYAMVRHPIYFGFLMALLGTAMLFGKVSGLVALALAFVGWRMKSHLEENFMMEQFGAEYACYRREVKALIPFVM